MALTAVASQNSGRRMLSSASWAVYGTFGSLDLSHLAYSSFKAMAVRTKAKLLDLPMKNTARSSHACQDRPRKDGVIRKELRLSLEMQVNSWFLVVRERRNFLRDANAVLEKMGQLRRLLEVIA